MKTERRHELQTNVLADWIGKHVQQVQGYSKTILAVVLLVIAVAIAGFYLAQDQAARAQASWNQFFQAFGERDAEALEIVAADNQGTIAGVWAHLAEADLKLAEGMGDLYTNRTNAKKNLAEAERNYLAVDRAATESLLRERAWFGLGQVYESLAELDKAKQYYGKLASSSPTSALGKEAKQRSDELSDPATEKWYNWFANQTPRPPVIPGMQDRFGLPNDPGDLGNISDRPDFSFPKLAPAGTAPEAAAPTDDAPEPGPELNSPAPEPTPPEPTTPEPTAPEPTTPEPTAPEPDAPTESPEKAADSAPEKVEAPAASKDPAEPTPSEPALPSSESPAESPPDSGEATPE